MTRSHHFLFLLLQLIVIESFAQRKDIDSLKLLLRDHQSIDTLLIARTNSLAYAYNTVDPDSTIFYARRAWNLAVQIDFKRGMASASKHVGIGFYVSAQNDSALYHYHQALALAQAIDYQELITSTYSNIGLVYYQKGNYDHADSMTSLALNLAIQHNNLKAQAQAYSALGNIKLFQGKHRESEMNYERSLAIQLSLGNELGATYSLHGLAAVNYELGHYSKSLDYLHQELQLAQSIGMESGISTALGGMVSIYKEQGKFEKAIQYQRRANQLYLEVGRTRQLTHGLDELGSLLIEKDSAEVALPILHQSLRLKEDIGYTCSIPYTLDRLGNCFGQLNQQDSAKFFLGRAITGAKACEDVFIWVGALINLGDLLLSEGALEKAGPLLNQAYDLSTEKEFPNMIQDAAELLSEYHTQRGNHEQAIQYLKKQFAIKDSLFDRETTEKIVRLESEYAFDKEKGQLLAQQEKEQALYEAEIRRKELVLYGSIGGAFLFLVLFLNFYQSYARKKQDAELILEQKNELQKLSVFREELTGMIAHDMKNSLNTIIGYSSSEPFDKKMQGINQSGISILNLVTNMLEVQRFEEASVKIRPVSTDIGWIMQEAKREVALLFQMKSVRLELSLATGVLLVIDQEMIKRVMVNLLTNAVKYSASGSTVNVVVKGQKSTGFCEVEVKDQGEGIAAEDLPKVFDRYWHAKARKSGQAASTGLGLAFCKLAIQAHNGTITAKSKLKEGTTFTIQLPMEMSTEVESHKQETDLDQLILDSERDAIIAISEELKLLKIYQISQITEVLDRMDQDGIKSRWKNQIVNAVHRADEEAYFRLLDEVT